MVPLWFVLVMLALVLVASKLRPIKLKSIQVHFHSDDPAPRELGAGRKRQKRLED